MEDIRCKRCGRLLFKCDEREDWHDIKEIEIKCPKCNYINKLEV